MNSNRDLKEKRKEKKGKTKRKGKGKTHPGGPIDRIWPDLTPRAQPIPGLILHAAQNHFHRARSSVKWGPLVNCSASRGLAPCAASWWTPVSALSLPTDSARMVGRAMGAESARAPQPIDVTTIKRGAHNPSHTSYPRPHLEPRRCSTVLKSPHGD